MIKICKNKQCNKEFETNINRKIYCCDKCQIKDYSIKYYEKNKEKEKSDRIKYYYEHQEQERKRRMEYYYNNLDKENSPKNKEKRRLNKQKYRNNPINKEKMWNYQKNKLKSDKTYYIKGLLRTRLVHAVNYYRKFGVFIKSKSGFIDYEKIIEHLKPFPEDLKKYHIDHIKPLCSFKLVNNNGTLNEIELKKAFAPENHQWLLAEENLRKWKN